ncbi:MAG TPA: siphovirus Gp157 family protein [Candidatus Angelobacter sp.]|nr:siphovirus Gp157 family protein [Candidatus Angelobacter sp.]
MSTLRLYDIPAEVDFFEQELIHSGGELTPELEERWKTFVKAGRDKIEGACMVVKNLEAIADVSGEESKRLYDRAHQFQKNAKRLKDLMVYAVDAFGGKVKTMLFTVWTQNAANRTSAELRDGTDLVAIEKTHPQFVRVKRELNTEEILKYLGESGWKPAPLPSDCEQCKSLAEPGRIPVAEWIEHHPKCTAEADAEKHANLPAGITVRWVRGVRFLRVK